MRAIAVDGLALAWREAPDPEPGPGEVAIAVAAAGVNRADLLQRLGAYPPPPGASPILGLECSGEIVAIGPGVDGWRPGDRVCALLAGGGYAERVVCPAVQLLAVPAGLDLVEAAALPEALCTAYMALRTVGRLADGERVLIHAGASGIGTATIRVCAAWGNPCFVTASTPDKVARCVALGADGGAARTDGPWADAVRAWAPGGVDVIVELVGQGNLDADQRALATGGRIAVIGLLGGTLDRVDLARMLTGRQTLAGATLRSRPVDDKGRIVAGVAREIWPQVISGKIGPVIDAVVPIERADEAHARMRENANVGKLVLSVTSTG